MNVFELEATLKLKTEDYQKGLSAAKSEANKFQSEISGVEKSAGNLGKAFEKSGDKISDAFKDVSRSADSMQGDVSDAFDTASGNAEDSFSDIAGSADDAASGVASAFDGASSDSADSFGEISDAADDSAGEVASAFSDVDFSADIDSEAGTAASSFIQIADAAQTSSDQSESAIESIGSSLDNVDSVAANMAANFSGNIGGMVGAIAGANIIGLIGEVANAVKEIGSGMLEAEENFEEAAATIAQGTGKLGDELYELEQKARQAWAAVADKDLTEEALASALANLDTRFGEAIAGFEEPMGEMFARFSKTVNVDAGQAVNDLADIMRQYNIVSNDANQNAATMVDIMNKITVATQSADLSEQEIIGSLTRNKAAYDELGFSMDEAIGLMVRYRDSGRDVSELSTGLYKGMTSLSESTDDVGGAMRQAFEIMQSGKSTAEILNTEVGNTGKTINDIFGKKSAQALIQGFSSISMSAEEWTTKLRESDTAMRDTNLAMTTYQDGLALIQNQFQAQTGMSGELITSYGMITGQYGKMAAAGQLMSAQNAIDTQNMIMSADSLASSVTNSTDEIVGNHNKINASNSSVQVSTDTLRGDIDSQMNMIKSAFGGMATKWTNDSEVISSTKPTVGVETQNAENSISGIKSIFDSSVQDMRNNSSVNMEIHGRIPTVSALKDKLGGIAYAVTGWTSFARGYNEAMMLTSPTIFGMNGDTPLIGGDGSGGEIVSGEKHLLNMMNNVVKANVGNIYSLLAHYLPSIADGTTVYLDGKKISDYVSKDINRKVNQRRV